ncbi:MAG: hypothetical protein H7Y17_04960 [Chlorobia bacterium]|nr:hypothetical protein [Fimbriimonadaceae bacterium]
MPETRDVELRMVLDSTMTGVWGGVQIGSGSAGSVKDWQRMSGEEARFVAFAQIHDGRLPLRGKVIQKDGRGRFLYIVWRDDTGVVSRRAKIYVESIDQTAVDSGHPIECLLPGKAKDGLPCCATVKPLRDWRPNQSLPG